MTTRGGLIRVEAEAAERATETVVAAFAEDEMSRRVGLPEQTMRRMFTLPVRVGLHLGEVYATSSAAEGVMVILKGEHANFGLRDIVRSGSVGTVLGLVRVFLNRHMRTMFTVLERDRKGLGIGPYWYLSMIAVAPEQQGQGHGGSLLRYLCDRADHDGRAIYLETQSESNVSLYEHFGFAVIKHMVVAEGIAMWEMVRVRGGGG